jgi:hypothetical protein
LLPQELTLGETSPVWTSAAESGAARSAKHGSAFNQEQSRRPIIAENLVCALREKVHLWQCEPIRL